MKRAATAIFLGMTAMTPVRSEPVPAAAFHLTIRPVRGDDGTVASLDVTERVDRGDSGAPFSAAASFSEFGVKQIAEKVTDLSVSDANGPLAVTITDDPADMRGRSRHWRSAAAPAYPVTLRYRIAVQPATELGGPPYGMKAAGGGVAGAGLGFLVLPESTAVTGTDLDWNLDGLVAGSVGVASAGKGAVFIPGPVDKMQSQWLLAGPAVMRDPTNDPGLHGYLLGKPPFDGPAMLDWAARAYRFLSDDFQYLGSPRYNLFIRALDIPSLATGTAMDTGGALVTVGNAFIRDQSTSYVRSTIFHEMTHQWVGQIEGRRPWFAEGLTTYFTSVLPCRARLIPWSECAEAVNQGAGYYYARSARHWSLAKIDADTSGKEAVRQVPYGRGMLYFAELDSKLRAKSKGKAGLIEAIRPLFAARAQGTELTQASWEAMLARELGPQAVADFRATAIEGTRTPDPASDAFGDCLTRAAKSYSDENGTAVDGFAWQVVDSSRCRTASAR